MNTPNYPKLKLKPGRDWTARRGHPWVFSGALQTPVPPHKAGTVVDLEDAGGEFVARGYYNSGTDIAVRILTANPNMPANTHFFATRLAEAYNLRKMHLDLETTTAFRLVNAEGDFIPGLIADYYAGVVVIQSHTAGIDQLLDYIIEGIRQVLQPDALLVRNDVQVRTREGLKREEPRLIFGEIPKELVITENSLKFVINPWTGQKTGFYADQRDKRLALLRYSNGDSLLNCFSYSGGFSVYAASANPKLKTTNLDQSAAALALARRNFSINELDADKHEFVVADSFEYLQSCTERYDTVILDPPAFAKSHREKEKALQGYVRLNTLGLPLIKPGGILLTCSCSGSISMEDFSGTIAQAAAQTHRRVQILESFENGLDHPVNIFTPESRYLKALFCRVLD
ncbi:MAG: class I SAM-dependent rRNA methyltransferase [Chloroflexi bacterium]|uniref:Class I SAM-dependent rRNA methyltransferase n=1 Tax=Candidatus Chlorohelix allophototropha TaxID=3003348 RepID=A0A8T7M312_9CHLR|nr:class I SAM-dependent rRNA methyltransferase [Chloroflexota bacterium]WJW67671.1 class I SAM-dependent rRNA methyltransferase [Chloroflexota bacterium L227-S17]